MSKYKKNEVGFRYPADTRRLVTLLCRLVYENNFPVHYRNKYIIFGEFPRDIYFTKREILTAYYLERKEHLETEISNYLLHIYITAIQWEMEEDRQ